MNKNFELVELKVKDPLRSKGVMYVGQYGTSGYAIAARGYICDFIMKGIPLSWTPLRFDDSEMTDDNYYNLLAKTALNKQLSEISTIILHCTADLWPRYKEDNVKAFERRNVIGYTVWETSALPDGWAKHINDCVNEVWCPSGYNEQVFRASGVTIPIRIVPHVFLKNELPNRCHVVLSSCSKEIITGDPNVYTFYSISEFNERKNVSALLEAYCKAFSKKDPVRLLLKTHYKNYNSANLTFCISKVTNILDQYPDHAPVLLLCSNLSELELLAVHSVGDCYVSMTRSEAFGLTIFDAVNYGKKVIVPGHGGHVDYLGASYAGLVNYTLEDVAGMEDFSNGYYMQGKQQWAKPSIDHAVTLMRNVANI